MFTGLVEAVGTVTRREAGSRGTAFGIRSPALADELTEGESVAVDGVCLTVTGLRPEAFEVVAVPATLARTTAATWEPGRRLNLERALRVGDRLGGALVQGHVDAVGRVTEMERAGPDVYIRVRLPGAVARVTVPRGSLTLDGVNLTVRSLQAEVAEVAIIPYTWTHTALDRLRPGERVNLEADLVGKYVARLLRDHPAARAPAPEGDESDGTSSV